MSLGLVLNEVDTLASQVMATLSLNAMVQCSMSSSCNGSLARLGQPSIHIRRHPRVWACSPRSGNLALISEGVGVSQGARSGRCTPPEDEDLCLHCPGFECL